jgi:uncharacterized membrane protein YdbT with pleckstrin-like domain
MVELDKDEHVLLEVRKHWLVVFVEISVLAIIALLPLFFAGFVESGIFVPVYSMMLLVLWVIGFVMWTSYYLDVWIITNKKIIDVEQHGLFSREISFLHIDKIQDVTYEVHGIVATMMNIGDVSVQTAGVAGEFPIKGVPNPEYVQTKIGEALEMFRDVHMGE